MTDADDPDYATLYRDCVQSQGRSTACDLLFEYLRPLLLRIARRISRQFDALADLDDVQQEIHLKMISAAATISNKMPTHPRDAVAYLSVVAANAGRDYFRGRKVALRVQESVLDIQQLADRVVGRTEASNKADTEILFSRIEECLSGSPREKIIFRLYYRQGFSAREIADIKALSLTVAGVESVIFRLTGQIRKCLRSRESTTKAPIVEASPRQQRLPR